MPDSLIWMDNLAFSDCTALSEVQLSRNIIGMYMRVFSRDTSLTEIYIPKSLQWAFQSFEQSSIRKVYYEGASFNAINGTATLTAYSDYDLEIETDVPFPY